MMFFWLVLLVALPFVLMWALRRDGTAGCCGMTHEASHTQPPAAPGPAPLEIARQRLARGEITVEQYEEIKRALS
ncbi:MAG: SHOCT domain-containing protein [Coriobacteriales bacterium]|nr:SHOCT domain-containing protein [Actinomycetes bacterium]